MRQVVLLLGTALIFATTAAAQTGSSTTQNDSSVNPAFSATFGDPGDFGNTSTTPVTTTTTPSFTPGVSASPQLFASQPIFAGPDGLSALTPYSLAASEPADSKPRVYGVFKSYQFQASAEYSFLRMYVASHPEVTENMNGFNFGLNYYPGGGWIAFDSEFMLEFGNLLGHTSHFAMIGGGPRFRWAGPEGIEIWGHALVGFSHLSPQTAYGGMGAFAFQAGGGADFGPHNRRIAYRVQADLVGTRLFGTYQYSPRIAAGVVFKF